jgi:hypothetical protein
MTPFLIQIREGSEVLYEIGVMSESAEKAREQHDCLLEGSQTLYVTPRLLEARPFAEIAGRHEYEEMLLGLYRKVGLL